MPAYCQTATLLFSKGLLVGIDSVQIKEIDFIDYFTEEQWNDIN